MIMMMEVYGVASGVTDADISCLNSAIQSQGYDPGISSSYVVVCEENVRSVPLPRETELTRRSECAKVKGRRWRCHPGAGKFKQGAGRMALEPSSIKFKLPVEYFSMENVPKK